MKLSVLIQIDEKTVYDANADMGGVNGDKVDPNTVLWMLYGMLEAAKLSLKVVAAEPEQKLTDAPAGKGEVVQ